MRFLKSLVFFGGKDNQVILESTSPSEMFPTVFKLFCLRQVEILTKGNVPQHQIVMPHIQSVLDTEADAATWFSVQEMWWGVFLYNSMLYNLSPFNDDLEQEVAEFESVLISTVNPWVDFLKQCADKQVSVEAALEALDDLSKRHLKDTHEFYLVLTRHHSEKISRCFTQESVRAYYRPLLVG